MSNFKNQGCLNCYETIQCLVAEIQELQSRQRSLKNLNNTLVETLNSRDNYQQLTDWKAKYEQQVRRSCRLQKKLMELKYKHDLLNQPKLSSRGVSQQFTSNLRQSRQKNMKRMETLINSVIAGKLDHNKYHSNAQNQHLNRTSKKVRKSQNNSLSNNQIVVRIVR